LGATVRALEERSEDGFEEADIPVGPGHRVRISSQSLSDDEGERMGRVVLFKEISHEPLVRDFEEIIGRLASVKGALRGELETARLTLEALGERVVKARVESANMSELGERLSRTRTAITNWLDVDDALAAEDYPDAQLLRDRLRAAARRWPRSETFPEAVIALTEAVEAYYESGENPRQRVL
jgi:hypothetical protein